MNDQVWQMICEYISHQGQHQSHIVFTGHSAGGAVASLFYLRYMSKTDLSKILPLSEDFLQKC